MARYLADTSAWHRSTAPPIADRWGALVELDELAMCGPVQLELLYSARSPTEYESRRGELSGLPWLELDERAVAIASRTQGRLAARSQHRGPAPVDLLVAAIAEREGVTLLHYDGHFDAIARVTGQPTEWVARRGSLD